MFSNSNSKIMYNVFYWKIVTLPIKKLDANYMINQCRYSGTMSKLNIKQ